RLRGPRTRREWRRLLRRPLRADLAGARAVVGPSPGAARRRRTAGSYPFGAPPRSGWRRRHKPIASGSDPTPEPQSPPSMPTTLSTRPAADEFLPYYGRYIDLVPDGNLVDLLADQQADT